MQPLLAATILTFSKGRRGNPSEPPLCCSPMRLSFGTIPLCVFLICVDLCSYMTSQQPQQQQQQSANPYSQQSAYSSQQYMSQSGGQQQWSNSTAPPQQGGISAGTGFVPQQSYGGVQQGRQAQANFQQPQYAQTVAFGQQSQGRYAQPQTGGTANAADIPGTTILCLCLCARVCVLAHLLYVMSAQGCPRQSGEWPVAQRCFPRSHRLATAATCQSSKCSNHSQRKDCRTVTRNSSSRSSSSNKGTGRRRAGTERTRAPSTGGPVRASTRWAAMAARNTVAAAARGALDIGGEEPQTLAPR